MNCNLCIEKSEALCYHCRQMQKSDEWIYVLDEGQRMCKCPDCGGRMYLGIYRYANPYKFCPYCGRRNKPNEQIALELNDCQWR